MISIIICCTYKRDIEVLKKNILDTAGIIVEFILIDNSKNNFSIFEAYNQGVEKSKFETLCFVHEDVMFHTQNWGKIILNDIKEKDVGLIGFAGSQYLFDFPTSWFMAKPLYRNLIQKGYKDGSSKKITFTPNKIEAAAVDGFCFFMPKGIFNDITFDSKNYKGFHFYDLDISMQVLNQNKKILLLNNIIIEHYSTGTPNESWFEAALQFYYKWHKQLPIKINNNIKISFIRKVKMIKKMHKLAKKENFSIQNQMELNKIASEKIGKLNSILK